MTWCVRKKIRLIVMPFWVHHWNPPSSATGMDRTYLKGQFDCGSLCLCWNTQIQENTLLHKTDRNQNISQNAVLQYSLSGLSQNHRISRVGRDPYTKTVYLLTQHIGTIAENYKEIVSLDTEFYYPNYSETLYLNKLIISDEANHTHC